MQIVQGGPTTGQLYGHNVLLWGSTEKQIHQLPLPCTEIVVDNTSFDNHPENDGHHGDNRLAEGTLALLRAGTLQPHSVTDARMRVLGGRGDNVVHMDSLISDDLRYHLPGSSNANSLQLFVEESRPAPSGSCGTITCDQFGRVLPPDLTMRCISCSRLIAQCQPSPTPPAPAAYPYSYPYLPTPLPLPSPLPLSPTLTSLPTVSPNSNLTNRNPIPRYCYKVCADKYIEEHMCASGEELDSDFAMCWKCISSGSACCAWVAPGMKARSAMTIAPSAQGG